MPYLTSLSKCIPSLFEYFTVLTLKITHFTVYMLKSTEFTYQLSRLWFVVCFSFFLTKINHWHFNTLKNCSLSLNFTLCFYGVRTHLWRRQCHWFFAHLHKCHIELSQCIMLKISNLPQKLVYSQFNIQYDWLLFTCYAKKNSSLDFTIFVNLEMFYLYHCNSNTQRHIEIYL